MHQSAKANKRRAQRQEEELAIDTGGSRQRGSGSLPWAKGDVRKKGSFRAECKFTRAKSYAVTRGTLDKIRSECEYDEYPVLDVSFLDGAGRTDERYIVVPYAVWLRLQKSEPAQSAD